MLRPRASYQKYIDRARTKRCKKIGCDIKWQIDCDDGIQLICVECGAEYGLPKRNGEFDKHIDAFIQRRKLIQPYETKEWYEAYGWKDREKERLGLGYKIKGG